MFLHHRSDSIETLLVHRNIPQHVRKVFAGIEEGSYVADSVKLFDEVGDELGEWLDASASRTRITLEGG